MTNMKYQVRNWDYLPVLISEKMFSAMTGLSVAKITDLCRKGELPGAMKIGKFWFIEKNKLKEHFTEGES